MGRILAIDYGGKRSGLAVTDESQIIASPLETVATNKLDIFLVNYFEKENVDCVVVGAPKRLHGVASDIEVDISEFILRIKAKFTNLRIEREDERFTSKMAFQSLIEAGAKKKDRKNKSNIDKISATLILQSFLLRNA